MYYTVYTIDFLSIELIGVELNSRLSGAQTIYCPKGFCAGGLKNLMCICLSVCVSPSVLTTFWTQICAILL